MALGDFLTENFASFHVMTNFLEFLPPSKAEYQRKVYKELLELYFSEEKGERVDDKSQS